MSLRMQFEIILAVALAVFGMVWTTTAYLMERIAAGIGLWVGFGLGVPAGYFCAKAVFVRWVRARQNARGREQMIAFRDKRVARDSPLWHLFSGALSPAEATRRSGLLGTRLGRPMSLGREEWSLDRLADSLSAPSDDRPRITLELERLAANIGVSPGQLRPEDVIEDLVGQDFAAGDRLLETEVRLQRATGSAAARRWTVKEVVAALVRGED